MIREKISEGSFDMKQSSSKGLRSVFTGDTNKWKKHPVVLYKENGTHWLSVFADKNTAVAFFATDTQPLPPLAQEDSEKLREVLRTGKPSQLASAMDGVPHLVALADIKTVNRSTETSKNSPEVLHCITISYASGKPNEREKHMKLASEHESGITAWATAINEHRNRPQQQPPPVMVDNETYDSMSRYFDVQLVELPNACPTNLALRIGERYRLQVNDDAIELRSLPTDEDSRSNVLAVWFFSQIRAFMQHSVQRANEYGFETGSRSVTGVGLVRFITPEALQLQQHVLQKKAKLINVLHTRAPDIQPPSRPSNRDSAPTEAAPVPPRPDRSATAHPQREAPRTIPPTTPDDHTRTSAKSVEQPVPEQASVTPNKLDGSSTGPEGSDVTTVPEVYLTPNNAPPKPSTVVPSHMDHAKVMQQALAKEARQRLHGTEPEKASVKPTNVPVASPLAPTPTPVADDDSKSREGGFYDQPTSAPVISGDGAPRAGYSWSTNTEQEQASEAGVTLASQFSLLAENELYLSAHAPSRLSDRGTSVDDQTLIQSGNVSSAVENGANTAGSESNNPDAKTMHSSHQYTNQTSLQRPSTSESPPPPVLPRRTSTLNKSVADAPSTTSRTSDSGIDANEGRSRFTSDTSRYTANNDTVPELPAKRDEAPNTPASAPESNAPPAAESVRQMALALDQSKVLPNGTRKTSGFTPIPAPKPKVSVGARNDDDAPQLPQRLIKLQQTNSP